MNLRKKKSWKVPNVYLEIRNTCPFYISENHICFVRWLYDIVACALSFAENHIKQKGKRGEIGDNKIQKRRRMKPRESYSIILSDNQDGERRDATLERILDTNRSLESHSPSSLCVSPRLSRHKTHHSDRIKMAIHNSRLLLIGDNPAKYYPQARTDSDTRLPWIFLEMNMQWRHGLKMDFLPVGIQWQSVLSCFSWTSWDLHWVCVKATWMNFWVLGGEGKNVLALWMKALL